MREDHWLMGAHLRIQPTLPRSFRRLLGAAWVSNTGDGVRNAAIPLIAASLTTSASTVTLVAAAGTLPFALFGVIAGIMVFLALDELLPAAKRYAKGELDPTFGAKKAA